MGQSCFYPLEVAWITYHWSSFTCFLWNVLLEKEKIQFFKIGLNFYLKIFAKIMKKCHIFHNLQNFVFLTVFLGSLSNFSLKKLYHKAYSLILKNGLNWPKWDKTLHGRSNTVISRLLQPLICVWDYHGSFAFERNKKLNS